MKSGKKRKMEIPSKDVLDAFMVVVMGSIGDLGVLIEYKKFD